MEVFISNLPSAATDTQIEIWLVPLLKTLHIRSFDLRKPAKKGHAKLTIADSTKAQRLIEVTRSCSGIPCHPTTGRPATFRCSKFSPDEFLLRVLRQKDQILTDRPLPINVRPNVADTVDHQPVSSPKVLSVECGRWESTSKGVAFVRCWRSANPGELTQHRRSLALKINSHKLSVGTTIFFDFTNIQALYLSQAEKEPWLTITLSVAPIICNETSEEAQLIHLFTGAQSDGSLRRVSTLPEAVASLAATCFVYRIALAPHRQLAKRLRQMTLRQVSIKNEPQITHKVFRKSFSDLQQEFRVLIEAQELPFSAWFQLEALWRNGDLSFAKALELLRVVASSRQHLSDDVLTARLRLLHTRLPSVGPWSQASSVELQDIRSLFAECITSQDSISNTTRTSTNEHVLIHRAIVTPTGCYLYGPDKETPNRVLRQYPGYEDCFLRVTFADELGDKIFYSPDWSNEDILRGRFLDTLQQQLVIAGCHYEFLGFSHSSLRAQSCWFMRSFKFEGRSINARSLIASLGDFSSIQCPAKCAARIGQAFSDTQKALKIESKDVRELADVRRGKYIFTDGCGTISESLWRDLTWHGSKPRPTLFQIRYQGAKGVISLDTSLPGRQMRLRKSMVKFNGSPSNDLEVCNTNSKPVAFKLNRQIIKILEDLNIGIEVFSKLQTQCLDNLRRSTKSTHSITEFISESLSGGSTGIPGLLSCLEEIGVEAAEDPFVRNLLRSLLVLQLRDVKFKGRIPVDNAVTLIGISDETRQLAEGQVFVTFTQKDGEPTYLEGTVAVTRSPALHPGDVQLVKAVKPLASSPLWNLTNCVVFSQEGTRDTASMLSGGDLDGDLFNIIFDSALIPEKVDSPAEYPPAEPVDVGRPVESNDMTEFFVNFMESDQLGRIASLHQIYADQDEEGTRSTTCLQLAALHSTAVDFSKSGFPVDVKTIPKSPKCRPDFMAPSVSTPIEDADGPFGPEEILQLDNPQRWIYYRSPKILGQLFRAVNEDEFFGELEDDRDSVLSYDTTTSVIDRMWSFVSKELDSDEWQGYLDLASELRDYYHSVLSELMSRHTFGNHASTISETEVVIGAIIGKSGAGNSRQREQSEVMKARYKQELIDIRQWMKEQTEGDPDQFILLAAACLSLYSSHATTSTAADRDDNENNGVEIRSSSGQQLMSFAWFSASLCIPQLLGRR